MEAVCSSEVYVTTYQTTQCNNPEKTEYYCVWDVMSHIWKEVATFQRNMLPPSSTFIFYPEDGSSSFSPKH
jgi:hypothetical protein